MTTTDEAIAEAFASTAFRLGEARGRWRLVWRNGTIAAIAIACATRDDGVTEYLFRFDLTNYPRESPTAYLWDDLRKTSLAQDLWPTGGPRIAQVFSTSFHPGTCLYLPCDRVAVAKHAPTWPDEHPHLRWSPERGLVFYLEIVSELLTSKDYQGRARST